MEEKDKLIASLRAQLRQVLSKNSALEQENALLNYELEQLKVKKKT
ncbi:hypothetical protein [Bacteroides sp. 51]|nr:hypothetical protein [Bacteroides sp. 51]